MVLRLLAEIAPGCSLMGIELLPGSYSNYTHLVTARSADGSDLGFVIRRYAIFGSYDRGEKARREFKALELVQRHDIPVPTPLYLDETGATLGMPGIVTSYVPGELLFSPTDALERARTLATMLAKIHSVPCGNEAKDFLLDANAEASWFCRSDDVPDYMRAHPDGKMVWEVTRDLYPDLHEVPPGLVHIDYWSGNVLWEDGRITAIVDWEEAAYGDPGIDVAYCRMDMCLSGMGYMADEFLKAYEAEMGMRVANLGFWELAAAVRPMFAPEGRITESPAKEEIRRFIANARKRAGR
jgi:aminoglycoside phosphotransferase (APT) family kinase protein